jgi:hypothetical protein
MKSHAPRWFFPTLIAFALWGIFAVAQDSSAPAGNAAAPSSPAAPSNSGQTANPPANATAGSQTQGQATGQSADPLKRPVSEKEKQKNSKALKQELSSTYKKWLNEDVIYIITPEEKSAFKQLSNDEERDQFIEQFWLRRDPTPDTPSDRLCQ